MQKSDRTKKYKRLSALYFTLSVILTYGPLLVAIVMGFVDKSIHTEQKMVLGFSLMAAIILTIFSVMAKHKMRSTIWILVLGVFICLNEIQWLLITIACCTIVDEFVISPLHKKCKNKFIINNEIDIRGQS